MKTARVLFSSWRLAPSQAADAAVLVAELERAGYQVETGENQGAVGGSVDLQFLVQNLQPNATKHVPAGRKNIFIPYLDQMPDWFKWMLGDFDACFCKTEDAAAWARAVMPAERVFMTGFTSRDCLRPEIPRREVVFHAGGANPSNNTPAALEALKNLSWPAVAAWFHEALQIPTPPATRVLCFEHELERERFDKLRNECRVHYYPATRENFGHLQNEARGMGAVLAGTPAALAAVLNLSREDLEREGALNRSAYLAGDAAFKAAFAGALESLETLPNRPRPAPAPAPAPAPSRRPRAFIQAARAPAAGTYLFSKARPVLQAPPAPRQFEVSIITRCMNRRRFLERTLPTWTACPHVKEIIIVDWSSTEPIQDVIDRHQNGVIRRVYVLGQRYFHRSKPINLGCRLSHYHYLSNVDVDVELKPDFFSIVTEDDCLYVTGAVGVYGTCIFSKNIFKKVNGYNEFFVNYGDEDTEFFDRVTLEHKFPCRPIPLHLCQHIDHGEKERLENHREKSLTRANPDAYGRWSTASRMETFNVIITEPDGRRVEATL